LQEIILLVLVKLFKNFANTRICVYFFPSKKGQKFEYKLERKEMERSKSAQTSNERSPVQKYQSLDEGIEHRNWSSAKQRQEAFSVVRPRSVDDAGEQSSFNRPNISEQTRDDQLFGSTGTPIVSTDSEYEVNTYFFSKHWQT